MKCTLVELNREIIDHNGRNFNKKNLYLKWTHCYQHYSWPGDNFQTLYSTIQTQFNHLFQLHFKFTQKKTLIWFDEHY